MDQPGGKLNHVNPILNTADLRTSIAFYTGILGFDLIHTFADPANFAIVGRDGHQIYLCERGQGAPGTWIALFVSDLADMWEQLAGAEVRVLMPYEADKGEFRVEDPDGHVLRFFA